MLEIAIPGSETLHLKYLVTDFNGTLACDGVLMPGAAQALRDLAAKLDIYVVTADIFGRAREALAGIPCESRFFPPGIWIPPNATTSKRSARRTACIGNGRNDRRMIAHAALDIAVVNREGAAVQTLLAAHVAYPTLLPPSDCCSTRTDSSPPSGYEQGRTPARRRSPRKRGTSLAYCSLQHGPG